MSRWKYLRERKHILAAGTIQALLADRQYCITRKSLARVESSRKAWDRRLRETEKAIRDRFGEQSIRSPYQHEEPLQ
jgi:hypothetical protein